jgi:asparagine synthase (glutamine-hydrolysing)
VSGFVTGFGNTDLKKILCMFEKIRHRGPWLSGIWEDQHGSIMAQNYLHADTRAADKNSSVPLSDEHGLRICYDGQIGNSEEIADAEGVEKGPFLEERTLLALYRKYGIAMLFFLDDAIFSFVIHDGEKIFAARDLLGIKTLFYGKKGNTLYLVSELKSLVPVTDDVHEFPPAHSMDREGSLSRYDTLPSTPPGLLKDGHERIGRHIGEIIKKSVRSRIDFSSPTAALLSGGMDSSVVTSVAAQCLKETMGKHARLKTFSVGIKESPDIHYARIMASHLGTDHEELIVGIDDMVECLEEVIYYLESFDPSLVRSSVSNFLISRYAREKGFEVLLSGEGGDEIFCGYTYLKKFPDEELFSRQMECIDYLHNNAALRLDRMNQAHSIRVVAPLISAELFRYALRIPSRFKLRANGTKKIEKWIFRKAYEKSLPRTITRRIKQEFSQGSGAAVLLSSYFEKCISDGEYTRAREDSPLIRSKEELHYFRLFSERFGTGKAVDTVGQWVSF